MISHREKNHNRRRFLARAGALAGGLALPRSAWGRTPPPPAFDKQVAAIVTNYRRYSHADNIVTRFIEGFSVAGKSYPPPCRVASLWIDQVDENDLGLPLAHWWEVPVVPSITEALTLGTGKLAVDAVLLIAEQGEYPTNDRGQKLYPRRAFFEQVVQVFRESGRAVPVYVDKHLSYSWDDAQWMYGQSRELGFPMMAGSSVPVAYRHPDLRPAPAAEWESALSVGYGHFEVYGFHALEGLQVMTERRPGDETGVSAVQCLAGDDVWRSAEEGRWDRRLLDAALATVPERSAGPLERDDTDPLLYQIEYRDGLKAATYMSPAHMREFAFAGRLRGREAPAACWYELPKPQRDHFSFLVQAIARMFESGRPTYPVERTLLTTGMLARLMESKASGGQRIEPPELDVRYHADPAYDPPGG